MSRYSCITLHSLPVRVPCDSDQEDDPVNKSRDEDKPVKRMRRGRPHDEKGTTKRIQPLPEHRNQAQVCVCGRRRDKQMEKSKRSDEPSPDDTRRLHQLENIEEESDQRTAIREEGPSQGALRQRPRGRPREEEKKQEDKPVKRMRRGRPHDEKGTTKRIQPLPEHRNQAQVCVCGRRREGQTDGGESEVEDREEQEERQTKPG
ncbi:hypothetical protein Pcinc_012283 [Petrolisthes cinctipes]|uniref:Uncharacterized protein n=1 Tax=Petrolisthes cinctipes TaxID=88211 RepID=A0AAE1FZE7_PETCI|nr:hypothetical protein Pcinc_012283 [Petrolisthes cinctipes]